MPILTLYHGRENHEIPSDDVLFFSTNYDFSKRYGEVKEYDVVFNNLFDCTSADHIERLVRCVGCLVDPYDGEEYDRYDSLDEANILAHDSWEMFESYMDVIEHMGFDGMRIFEGGIENYVVFSRKQFKIKVFA